MQTASLENRAGFWPRLAAYALDRLILCVVLLFVRIPGWFSSGDFYSQAVFFTFTAMDILRWVLISLYFVILTAGGGATLGKKAMGLRVVSSETGEKPSFLLVLYRETVGRYLSRILYAGYFLVAVDSEKRGLHDRICDTAVVYTQRSNKDTTPPPPPQRVLTIVPVDDPVKDWYAPYRK